MSAAEAVCLIRGYHRPVAEITPYWPSEGYKVDCAEHVCRCGWRAYLPFILTAAKVLFTCDKCGENQWTWRAK